MAQIAEGPAPPPALSLVLLMVSKLPLTSVADGHDLLLVWVCPVVSSLCSYDRQSLQIFCASAASTNFKAIFEWMKIICLYVACKIRAKDK